MLFAVNCYYLIEEEKSQSQKTWMESALINGCLFHPLLDNSHYLALQSLSELHISLKCI